MIDISRIKINKQLKKATSVALMGTLCAISIFSVNTFARDVYVNVDNNTIHSVTLNDDVNSILNKVGVQVSDEDIVEKYDNPDGSLKLNVKRVLNISVRDESKQVSLKMTSGKVSDAIEKSGFVLGDYDITNYDLNSELQKEMKIVIVRRNKVCIVADNEEKEYLIPQCSVENALNYIGLELGENDIINHSLTSKLHNNMKIVINRIKFENITKIESIPRNTVTKESNLIDIGIEKVVDEGKDGKKEVEICNTLKDNEVINSEIINSSVLEKPQDRVVLKGNKKSLVNSSSNKPNIKESHNKSGNNDSVAKIIYGSATAYTASRGARTSTGKIPIEGQTVAVNPKVIPYGSKILVESTDGTFRKTLIAQDTGGALRSGSAVADIYMDSVQSCRSFGRKSVKISVLK